MAIHVRYRLGRLQDALVIGVLVRRTTRRWVLPGQPASAALPLLAGMTARSIRQKMQAGQRFYLAWQDDGRLVGVAAMRDDTHLLQFFVSTRLQGQGIGRQLWQRTMREAVRRAGTRRFTLNSSIMAVPVYQRLGFVVSGPVAVSASGLSTQPMHLDLP